MLKIGFLGKTFYVYFLLGQAVYSLRFSSPQPEKKVGNRRAQKSTERWCG